MKCSCYCSKYNTQAVESVSMTICVVCASLLGVVNQPFWEKDESGEWHGRYFWGVCHGDYRRTGSSTGKLAVQTWCDSNASWSCHTHIVHTTHAVSCALTHSALAKVIDDRRSKDFYVLTTHTAWAQAGLIKQMVLSVSPSVRQYANWW